MTRFTDRLRDAGQACRKCGAAAGEYCRHSKENRPKVVAHEKYQLSEQSIKAIDEWLRRIE